jgi:PAS domain S-box-containing protein
MIEKEDTLEVKEPPVKNGEQKNEAVDSEEESFLASIVRSSVSAITGIDLEGKIIYWNSGAEKTYGYKKEEVLGKSINILIPDQKDEFGDFYSNYKTGKKTEQFESKRVRKDGKIIDVTITVSPIKNKAGELSGFSTISADITQKSQSSQYARNLIEASIDPFFTIGIDGKITDVNQATVKVTGQGRGLIIGTDFSDYFTDPEKAKTVYSEVFDKGTITDLPLTLKGKDGELVEVLCNASVYRDAPGNAIGVFVAARDISEIKKSEESLIKSRIKLYQFKKFFDLSVDMVCIANTSYEYEIISPSFSTVLGWDESEIMEKSLLALVHEEDLKATEAELEKLKTGATISEFTNRLKCKDGTYKYFQWILSVDTLTEQIFGIARDYTKRKQAEEEIKKLNDDLQRNVAELEVVNKELGSFSYSVSHDLRASLRAISGFTQLLSQKYQDKIDEEGRRLMSVVGNNAKKMGQLIDDLLSYSRLGKKEIQKTDIDTKELVDSLVQDLNKSGLNDKAKITVSALSPMKGDKSLMRQVFFNLLVNALKFSRPKPNPEIEIGSKTEGDENIYYVKDNGVGFDMKFYDKLFNVSQRLHSQEEFEGAGVGLAIASKIIGRHGGKIWAEGKVNEGATFYFSVPEK